MKVPAWVYRFGAEGAALAAFLLMSWLYRYGDRGLYESILAAYGVAPSRFPFVDISGSLAAWECARQGIDVIVSDPCDVLHRGYTYSPLWMAAAGIPLGVSDTMPVGWILDLLFIASLSLLPPPRRRLELALTLAAALSTMVVFALERANPDILLFMLALAAGYLAECRLGLRLLGYCVALLAALIKYYPIVVLIIVLRERVSIATAVLATAACSLGLFWVEYHGEIARGLPNIPSGRYDTDLFAAQNLPFLVGMVVENAAEPSAWAPLVGHIAGLGLYAALAGAAFTVCRRVLRLAHLRAALAALPSRERVLLVIGSAVIAGCFFAGQSIGYRGVFLLLVIPGLLAIARAPVRELRVLGLAASFAIVLLMWGECFRAALYDALYQSSISAVAASEVKIQFLLVRELGWWWTVSVMLAIVADFLRDAPILRGLSFLFGRPPVRAR